MVRMLMVSTVAATLRAFLLPFADHFRQKGWRVDGLARGISDCEECQGRFDRTWEAVWSRNPLDRRNMKAVSQVQQLVAQEHYDLVHVHTPVASFLTRYALRGLREQGAVKVIYTAHGFHFYKGGRLLQNLAFRTLEAVAGRWTDHLVVINREDEEAALRHKIVPRECLTFMPGIGVDLTRYSPVSAPREEVERVRIELGLAPGQPLFLMIAEFIPRKRHQVALQALSRLPRNDVHLAFAGDGPLLDALKRQAMQLGLHDRVHFLGFRRDIPVLISASTAVVLPSVQEGLPRSVMESLAIGVPVIGTDIRGVRDLLADGAGLLVPADNPEELANAMSLLIGHPEESRRISEIGRRKICDYDLENIISMHEQLYHRVLGETRPASARRVS